LIAYDICGVQPMTGPTGLIFAMRSRYATQSGAEALFAEANTGFASFGGANTTANLAGGYAGNSSVATANLAGGAANNVGSLPSGSGNNAGNGAYNYASGFGTSLKVLVLTQPLYSHRWLSALKRSPSLHFHVL